MTKGYALPLVAGAREALRVLTLAASAAGIKPAPAYLQEMAAVKAQWEKQLQAEVCVQVPGGAVSQSQVIPVLNPAESRESEPRISQT
ncbi:MAG: hypothetical protein M5U01_34730 [Ardenticatenaceae bacterium]|nr:hypothetical protein [Ardenticatenaceae bacterium]